MRQVFAKAVLLAFGFVFAQSQGTAAMLLRSSLAKSQNSSLRTATEFLSMLWASIPLDSSAEFGSALNGNH
jgi:hypothetical protein